MRRQLLTLVPAVAVAALAVGGLIAPTASAAASAPPAPADKILTGFLQVRSALLTAAAGTQTYGEVSCPRASKLVSGGAILSGNDLQQNTNSSIPGADTRTWRVWVNNASAVDGAFRVVATCVRRVDGYTQVLSDGVRNPSGTQVTATVSCPAGTVPLGGGGLTGSSSTRVSLSSSFPTTDGWRVDTDNASSGPSDTAAYAICGAAPTGYIQVTGRTRPVAVRNQAEANASCPTGRSVLGGGGLVAGDSVAATLDSIAFYDADTWQVFANNTASPRTFVTAVAVCAKVTA